MKNIWIFNHYIIPPSIEEGHRHVKFANRLVERGYKPVLFYSSYLHRLKFNVIEGKQSFKIEEVDDVKYIGLKTRSYTGNKLNRVFNMIDYFVGMFKVSSALGKQINKPDVVIASSVHPLTCIAGIMISQKLDVPCVIEIRDLWPLTLVEFGKIRNKSIITKAMYLAEKWIYRKANKIIFTMEGGIDYVKKQGWVPLVDPTKIHHINNGIDLEKFNNQKETYEFKDIDLDNAKLFKVVYAGSLGEANAPMFIVETAKKLIDYDQLKIIIFGDGSQKDALQAYCKNENLTNVVFKGRVDKKFIPNILSKGNLNIFTGLDTDLYKYGISLNKLFDYFASGKPTLSNLKCGYDLLERYRCGETVQNYTPEAFAEGILKYYQMNENEYNTYCENAIFAAKEYDFKKLTSKLIDILNSCER